MGVEGEIRVPKWKGRNENLEFLNVNDADIPPKKHSGAYIYRDLVVKIEALAKTGQAFSHENPDIKKLRSMRWWGSKYCKKKGYPVETILRPQTGMLYFRMRKGHEGPKGD